MPSIDAATIRKILDSRGEPTVEVDVVAQGVHGRAAAPSGATTGTHEGVAFPEGGVDAATARFAEEVKPRLLGREVTAQKDVDRILHEIDGTPNFARLGGDGTGARSAVFANARVHRTVRDLLRKKLPAGPLGRGDEGAWVAPVDDEDALGILADACRAVSKEVGFEVRPALDLAASEFFRDGMYRYRSRTLTPEQQIDFVASLAERFGLFSVEDPLHEDDFAGYARLTSLIGTKCLVIGDDLFVTSVARLREGIDAHAANAILIKPNQIGTLSDAKAAGAP